MGKRGIFHGSVAWNWVLISSIDGFWAMQGLRWCEGVVYRIVRPQISMEKNIWGMIKEMCDTVDGRLLWEMHVDVDVLLKLCDPDHKIP